MAGVRWCGVVRRRTAWIVVGLAACAAVGAAGCSGDKISNAPPKPGKASKDSTPVEGTLSDDVQSEPWGQFEGREIKQYLLTNGKGMRVSLTNFGASITSVDVPDRDGNMANVTLSFPSAAGYEKNAPFFGCVCGRYANRIALGKFKIGEEEFTLATNNPPNHLHGGVAGFNRKVWNGSEVRSAEGDGAPAVKFTYESPDGEEGYPGTLKVSVTYSLGEDNGLKIEYSATTDKPTPVNLCNHAYWNLAGADSGTVLDHVLMLSCDTYLPVTETMIPTGERKSVDGTPMDFRKPTSIGSRIDQVPGGYDHCYVINDGGKALVPAGRLSDPKSGRVMQVFTTEPGVQLYTGNFLDGTDACEGFPKHAGVCLETQRFPDSPNQPDFPNSILTPGQVYSQTTVYKFSVDQ